MKWKKMMEEEKRKEKGKHITKEKEPPQIEEWEKEDKENERERVC